MNLIPSPFGAVGQSIARTLRYAKENGISEITLDKNTYHVYANESASPVVCVANHGYNGFKAAAFAIEDMENLTIDCGGSTFLLHGQMDFAIISRSKNITLRNAEIICLDTCNFQGKVIESSNECVKMALEKHPTLHLNGNYLSQKFFQEHMEVMRTLDYVTETRELRRGTGDNNFGLPLMEIRKEFLDENTLCFYDVPVAPPVGDTIVFAMSRRCNQGVLVSHSENVLLEDITIRTCWGIGFIVQKCTNITLRRCSVTPEDGNCWSAGQDATHFVNCRGTVVIEDGVFENQLDDAVNLHGIYTLVEKSAGDCVMMRYMHFQARGIDIYGVGDRIQIMDRESQQPLAFATVADVEVLNAEKTMLRLTDIEGEIKPGMIAENLSDECDAYIRNNVIRNNRARGMLIAAKGHIEITGNHFHSGGSAIQFESDPMHWFECGGTVDVVIADNFFDDCRHGKWSRAVIDINRRRKNVDGFYYHDTIAVRNNRFTQTNVPCAACDNVKNFIFEGNEYAVEEPVKAAHAFVNGVKYDDDGNPSEA